MASLKHTGFCSGVCLVLIIGLIVLLLPSSSAQTALASRYENYTYQVSIANRQCQSYTYTYCYNWWYWNYWLWGWNWYPYYYYGYYWNPWYGYGWWSWCNNYQQTFCYYYYTSETRTAQRCQAGWVGNACNVPTCTPSCSPGLVCIDLNKCGCAQNGSTNSNCQIVPCSPMNNCYPGTCVNGTSCSCPPGFSGPNCINFAHKPSITKCEVKLYAKPSPGSAEIQVARADCAAEGLTPRVVWINGPLLNPTAIDLGLTKIEPTWTASYTFPSAMPAKPSGASTFFIGNAPVRMGIYDGDFYVSFPDIGFNTGKEQCSYPNLKNELPNTATCTNPTNWNTFSANSLIGHNKTFVVKMSAVLGGTKIGDSTYLEGSYSSINQLFNGTPVVVQSMLKFDLRPPTHCLLQQAGSITPGNDRINCTLYPIYLDQDIRTNPVIRPLFLDWTDDGSGIEKFHVEVFWMQPGTDGVLQPNGGALADSVADVTQQLNNYQFTVPRSGVYSIVVTAYDLANNSATARKIFNYMDQPSYSITNSPVFIQESNAAVNHSFITSLTNPNQLTLIWSGRFQANPLYGEVLSKRVGRLPITPNTIDDIYGSQFGQRSINAVDNQTGISSYTVRYLVDKRDGGLGALPTDANDTATINGETATLTFGESLQSGDTVVMWLTATGSTGNQTTYQLNVGLDTTKPNVSSQSFTMNGVDQYTSSVTIVVVDRESGINSTRYTIIDQLSGVVIVPEQTSAPITRDPPNRRKRQSTSVQTPCTPSDTSCYCTPFKQCWPYLQTIEINNCLIDKFAGQQYKLIFRYWITNKAGSETTMNAIELGDISGVACRQTSRPTAVIIGIVIGCVLGFLVLVFLVVCIVVVIIRIRQHQPPIPSRDDLRTMRGNFRDRFTVRSTPRENASQMYSASSIQTLPAPAPAPAPPPYAPRFNNSSTADMEGSPYYTSPDYLDQFKISKNMIQVADILAEGRFAVIRKAHFTKARSKETVAVKALKNGFSQKDDLLMTQKVSARMSIPPHSNLVQFIGFIDEFDAQGKMMVLELCDYPLKDWLANLSDISTDTVESMLIFTLNIAQGVAHLHAHRHLHRRLAVRNVLLKQEANGFVAKLIGFGPNEEDSKNDCPGTGVSVPIKWLAPETLDSMNSSKPVYSEKTDAWSYGITIWEIYSQGAVPYADLKSSDVRSHVKRGYRLQCPTNCPSELFGTIVEPCWLDSARQRPTFSAIVEEIQKFRRGYESRANGYYGTDEIN